MVFWLWNVVNTGTCCRHPGCFWRRNSSFSLQTDLSFCHQVCVFWLEWKGVGLVRYCLLDVIDDHVPSTVHKYHRSNQKISDPVTRHIVFEQCRVLHDSLDSLSSEDDRRQITRLIARFVQLVGICLFHIYCKALWGMCAWVFVLLQYDRTSECILLSRRDRFTNNSL